MVSPPITVSSFILSRQLSIVTPGVPCFSFLSSHVSKDQSLLSRGSQSTHKDSSADGDSGRQIPIQTDPYRDRGLNYRSSGPDRAAECGYFHQSMVLSYTVYSFLSTSFNLTMKFPAIARVPAAASHETSQNRHGGGQTGQIAPIPA